MSFVLQNTSISITVLRSWTLTIQCSFTPSSSFGVSMHSYVIEYFFLLPASNSMHLSSISANTESFSLYSPCTTKHDFCNAFPVMVLVRFEAHKWKNGEVKSRPQFLSM